MGFDAEKGRGQKRPCKSKTIVILSLIILLSFPHSHILLPSKHNSISLTVMP